MDVKKMITDDDLELVSGGEESPALLSPDAGGLRMSGDDQMTINLVCRECNQVRWFTKRQEHYYCPVCCNLIV